MSTALPPSLGDARYVRLTTFRRTGEAVPTPVWTVPSGNALLVYTSGGTGKVTRIRHTPRVLLAPCDARGRVADGVADTPATATVVDDPVAVAQLRSGLVTRYRLQARALLLVERLRRRRNGSSVRLELRLTGDA